MNDEYPTYRYVQSIYKANDDLHSAIHRANEALLRRTEPLSVAVDLIATLGKHDLIPDMLVLSDAVRDFIKALNDADELRAAERVAQHEATMAASQHDGPPEYLKTPPAGYDHEPRLLDLVALVNARLPPAQRIEHDPEAAARGEPSVTFTLVHSLGGRDMWSLRDVKRGVEVGWSAFENDGSESWKNAYDDCRCIERTQDAYQAFLRVLDLEQRAAARRDAEEKP